MSVAGLAYVALAVADVAGTAQIFEQHFGLGRRDARRADGRETPLFGVGESALALFASDDPFLGDVAGDAAVRRRGVHHFAIATSDAAGLAERLDPAAAEPRPGLDGRREMRLDARATCGVRTRLCEPLDPPPGGSGRIERIDHLGIASTDNVTATHVFSTRLGLAVESTQTDLEVHTATESFTSDRYGVVYHNRPARIVGGLRVSFITIGDCDLEFLQPLAPEGVAGSDEPPDRGPGTTRGDKGAIGRYLQKHGPGLHHLALKTADIDATLTELSRRGIALIDTRGRPGSRRARIGFIHPRALGGILVHLVQRDEL